MKLLLITLLALAYSTTTNCAPPLAPEPPSLLEQDLLDFDKLYPEKEVLKIIFKYSYQINLAWKYINSTEFITQLSYVEQTQEFQDILGYLQESKLDVYTFFNAINKMLGIDYYFPTVQNKKIMNGTLVDMLYEIQALVPREKLFEMYTKKMQTSPDYANLVKRLHSPVFKNFTINFIKNPKVSYFIKSAYTHGIPFIKYVQFYANNYFGFMFYSEEAPVQTKMAKAYNFMDDFEDFFSLIPTKDIRYLFYQYLMNDKEFKAFFKYLQSAEFATFMKDFESMPDFKAFLQFFEDAGFPAYKFLDKFNEFLKFDKMEPVVKDMSMTFDGVKGFFAKVKSMIPFEKLQALYKYKLENSKGFAAFIQKFKSKEFQNLFYKLTSNEKYKELSKTLEYYGFKFQEFYNYFSSFFGFTFPLTPSTRALVSKTLWDDFQDFYSLFPVAEIKQLFENYMYEDAEFQDLIVYLYSDDFDSIVMYVESLPEFTSFLDYLEAREVPAYEMLDKFNDWFLIDANSKNFTDLDSQEENMITSRTVKGGLKGFLKDFKKLLPKKELKLMYKLKMSTSTSFQEFVLHLKSLEFQAFVNKVFAYPKVQELITSLKEKGIKMDKTFVDSTTE